MNEMVDRHARAEEISAERLPLHGAEQLADRGLFFLTGLAVAAVFLLFAYPAFRGETYFYGDIVHLHIPLREFYAQCLRSGESFIWIPDIFCGFYLQGEGQVGLTHPAHMLAYRFLPVITALNIEVFIHYPLWVIGTFLFLRRHGLSRTACLIGGALTGFSSFAMIHVVHPNLLVVLAHIPWLLLALDAVVRGTRPLTVAAGAVGMALIVGSQGLLGFPQSVWMSFLMAAAYFLYLGRQAWRPRTLVILMAAGVIGALLAAVQLLPTYDALSDSFRDSTDAAFRLDFPAPPKRLVEMALPHLFSWEPHEWGIYGGAATPAIIILALMGLRRMEGRRRLVIWALIVAAISLWLALGGLGKLGLLMMHIPLVGKFRCPARHMIMVYSALAIVAAVVVDQLVLSCRRREKPAWPVLLPGGVSVMVAAVALALVRWGQVEQKYVMLSEPGVILTGLAIVLAGVALVFFAARGVRGALPLLLVFIVADAGWFGISSVWNMARDDTPPSVVEVQPNSWRIRASRNTNHFMKQGYPQADGYASLKPGRETIETPDGTKPYEESLAFLRVASTRWVLPDRESPYWTKDVPLNQDGMWVVPDPLPRLRLVTRAVASQEPAEETQRVDVATTVVLPVSLEIPEGPVGEAQFIEERPGRIVVEAHAPSRQVMVLSQRYHSGWKATVDGKSAQLLPAYATLTALPLEAGSHRVEMRFEPKSYRLGMKLSLMGLALLPALAAGAWMASRKRMKAGSMPALH